MANRANADSWFPRCRLAWIERQAKAVGHVQRKDLMAVFDVSPSQASGDFQSYLALNPGALVYSTPRKRYEWKGEAFVIDPAPWDNLFPTNEQ